MRQELELSAGTYLATQGNIVLQVDGRGSRGRGEDWRRQLGEEGLGLADVEDQTKSLRYVLDKFSFISKRRVGVLGSQYGGWLAAMILANSGAVQCGVFTDPIMQVDRLGGFNKHLPVRNFEKCFIFNFLT